MTGFIFLPPVYWERVAYLHVNSSRSPAASLKVVNGATCKGRRGEEEEGDAVWGAREVHSCFLWCREEKPVSLILKIRGDREWAVAEWTQAKQTGVVFFFNQLNTDLPSVKMKNCYVGHFPISVADFIFWPERRRQQFMLKWTTLSPTKMHFYTTS